MSSELDMIDECLASIPRGKISGVVHLGAATGQEAPIYQKHGIRKVIWIEANPQVIPQLGANVLPLGHSVIQAAIYWTQMTRAFNISNNEGSSSSLYEFGTHKEKFPHVKMIGQIEVQTTRLDDILPSLIGRNMLVMDIQGAEYDALFGGRNFLRHIDYVFTEINFDQLYAGCRTAEQLELLLAKFSCEKLWDHGTGAGDAFYVRNHYSAADHRARIGRA